MCAYITVLGLLDIKHAEQALRFPRGVFLLWVRSDEMRDGRGTLDVMGK